MTGLIEALITIELEDILQADDIHEALCRHYRRIGWVPSVAHEKSTEHIRQLAAKCAAGVNKTLHSKDW